MLTRPGAEPGSSWMKRLSDRIPAAAGSEDPEAIRRMRRFQKWNLGFWLFFVVLMVFFSGRVGQWWLGPSPTPYESETRIAGLPLYAQGDHPRGIIAVGGVPVGVIAVGGVAVGVVALGGVAAGGVALSGVSLGILALGGLAVGWWALGGVAIGYHALGGLAVGGYAYAGNGVAYGYHEASGRQKEKLFG